jgi:hypothetical protein
VDQIIGRSQELNSLGFVEQAAALSDGEVSEQEYRSAFDDLGYCLARDGITVTEPQVSPIDNLRLVFSYSLNGVDGARAAEIQATCEERYWSDISAFYVGTHPKVLDPKLVTAVTACLNESGIETRGDETAFRDLAGSDPVSSKGTLSERAAVASTCLEEAVNYLFPGFPYVVYDL